MFWDIELRGQATTDTTWLVPTADDDFSQKDPTFHKVYALPIPISSAISITVVPIRDTGVLDIIGGELWEACFYLCAYILQRADYFASSRVLELGAGLGLPGLLIAELKVRMPTATIKEPSESKEYDVCLTDYSLELLQHLSKTAEDMGARCVSSASEHTGAETRASVTLTVRHLDWQSYVDISDCDWTLKPRCPEQLMSSAGCDVIIGSALVYSPTHSAVAFVLR